MASATLIPCLVDGNYCELTVLPAGAVQVPQRPGTFYTWDTAASAWVADIAPALLSLEQKVQQYLDQKAQAKGYDSAASCISYLNSSNATWKADAIAMNTWRDDVWNFCFTNEASVKAGTTPLPTSTQLIAALPAAPW